jgi:hypothetical protein
MADEQFFILRTMLDGISKALSIPNLVILSDVDILRDDIDKVIKGLSELDTTGKSKLPYSLTRNLELARDELDKLKLFRKIFEDRKLTLKQEAAKIDQIFAYVAKAKEHIQKALSKLD